MILMFGESRPIFFIILTNTNGAAVMKRYNGIAKSKLILILSVTIVFFSSLNAFAAENTNYNLPNGLKVILLENHRAPVVSMLVWVKVGSALEREGEYGLAHLMEHMLFKGTDRRGPGEIAREVEAAGGHINAFTSYDQTVYYINMASRYTERGLDILGDMIFNPKFDPEEFRLEKEVVLEEIREGEDNPGRVISKALFGNAYRVHPYKRPVIGFVDSVRNVDRETALAFHKQWYRPDNMVLVVSGDFEINTLKEQIAKIFSARAKAEARAPIDMPEPKQEGPRGAIVRKDLKTATIQIGFHIPGFNGEQTKAVDLLGAIAGQGRTSRLYKSVMREKELVSSISAGAYTPKDPGLFIVSAKTEPEKVLPAVKAIMKELQTLVKDGVTSEELERAKLNVQAGFIRSRMTMSGESRVAANFEVMAGDYRSRDDYLAGIENTTAGEIRQAANEYLTESNMTIALLLPDDALPNITEGELTSQAALLNVPQEEEKKTALPTAVKQYRLKNGVRLLVKPDHSLPLVSIRAAFMGGLRYENKSNNGLNNLMAEIWDRGTTDLTPEELAREVEDMAGYIGSYSGRNSFGLEAEFMSRFLDRGLELFTDVLTQPAFDQAEVEKARPIILAAIKQQQDRAGSKAFKKFAKTIYSPHPYGLDQLGTPETVSRLKAQDVRDFYMQFAKPEGMVLSVVGDVDPEKIRDRFEELLKDWQGKVEKAPEIPAAASWTGIKEADEFVDKAQAHMVLGFPAPGMNSPDRFALEILDNILSGMGGRLFIQLRDKQSLAYTVTSFYSTGLDTGAFGFYISFSPDKLEQVEQGFMEIIKQATSEQVTEEELSSAKELIMGSYEIGLQSYNAQASETTYNELYGLGLDYPEKYMKAINAVTREDVLNAARKYLNMDHAVRVVVGPIKDASASVE